MYKRSKVEKQLEEVQKNCSVRTLRIDEVESHVAAAEKALAKMNLPVEALPFIHYETYECVNNSYGSTPYATKLVLTFTKKATVKDVKVTRDITSSMSHGGTVQRFLLDDSVFPEAFGLDHKTHNRVINLLKKAWGFNPQSTCHI